MGIMNAFNSTSHKAILWELQVAGNQLSQLFLFICGFFVQEFFLLCNHHFPLKYFSILFLSIGLHYDNLFIRPLFAFAHFCVLHCYSNVFPSFLFPSLVDDTHILDLASIITPIFIILSPS